MTNLIVTDGLPDDPEEIEEELLSWLDESRAEDWFDAADASSHERVNQWLEG